MCRRPSLGREGLLFRTRRNRIDKCERFVLTGGFRATFCHWLGERVHEKVVLRPRNAFPNTPAIAISRLSFSLILTLYYHIFGYCYIMITAPTNESRNAHEYHAYGDENDDGAKKRHDV